MDRRVRKTKQALEDAFLALEHQKPANQITVAELCALADVGRGTFYLHYQDVQALAAEIGDRYVQALLDQFAKTGPQLFDGSYRDWLNSLLHYLHSHQAAFALILRGANRGAVQERLQAAFAALLPGDALEVTYTVSGAMGLISAWLLELLDVDQAAVVARLDQALLALVWPNGVPSNSTK